jgi:hypothetical protein
MNTEKLNSCIGKNVFIVVSINETFKTSKYGKLVSVTSTSIVLEDLFSLETTIPFEKNGMKLQRILDDQGDDIVFADVMIADCDMTVRAHNICRLLGISTLAELADKKLSDLREGRLWERKGELELIEVLRSNGLSFREE